MAEEQKRELEETKEFLDLWIKGAGRAQRTYNQELKKKEEEIRDLKSKLERADWSTRRRPRRKTDRGHQATVGREKSIPKETRDDRHGGSTTKHTLEVTGVIVPPRRTLSEERRFLEEELMKEIEEFSAKKAEEVRQAVNAAARAASSRLEASGQKLRK